MVASQNGVFFVKANDVASKLGATLTEDATSLKFASKSHGAAIFKPEGEKPSALAELGIPGKSDFILVNLDAMPMHFRNKDWYISYASAELLLTPYLRPDLLNSRLKPTQCYLLNVSHPQDGLKARTDKLIMALAKRNPSTMKVFPAKGINPVADNFFVVLLSFSKLKDSEGFVPPEFRLVVDADLVVPARPLDGKSASLMKSSLQIASMLAIKLQDCVPASLDAAHSTDYKIWNKPQFWMAPTITINVNVEEQRFNQLEKDGFKSFEAMLNKALRNFTAGTN
jgi:hypothetical protein